MPRPTQDVDQREVNCCTRRGLATEIEQGLRIEGSAPGEGVDPSEERRQKGEEAEHCGVGGQLLLINADLAR